MYEAYWKLSQKPFVQRVTAGRMYRSQTQQAARLRLKYCIDNGLGLSLVIGQAGTGKTSLLKSFSVAEYNPVIHIVFPLLETDELLRMIASDLRSELSPSALATMTTDAILTSIRNSLRQNSLAGQHTLICIDDAHQLTDQAILHVVQPLMNLCDVDEQASLALILAGQPVLSSRLRKHAQISDRVAVTAALHGFTQAETIDYVRNSLAAVGATEPIFTDRAVSRLFEVTGGIPRRVNRLADMALLVGYAEQLAQITETEINAISHELMPAAA